MEEHEIARFAICDRCGKPNLLWQPWRKRFRCGWCRKDHTKKRAAQLEKLSELACRQVEYRRQDIIKTAERLSNEHNRN